MNLMSDVTLGRIPLSAPKLGLIRLGPKIWGRDGKVECIFPMVIWSDFFMADYRDDDHQESAPHFYNGLVLTYLGIEV